MAVDDMARLTATLALLANTATAVLALALVVGPRVDALDRLGWWARDRAFVLVAAVALVSTLGSLYYSEVADFEPCRYCWYQRIAMYPIVVVAAAGARSRDASTRISVAVLAGVGLVISTWHWLIQHNPEWVSEESCSLTAPCTSAYVEEFGFVTIPWMAGSGFALIIALVVSTVVLREEIPQ